MYKFGYVGIVGNTNAGKSTLLNAFVGMKIAIVSPKKQTTRDNVLGIMTKENFQLVFVDTPGLHRTKNKLDKYMMKNVRSATGGVDTILFVTDANKKLSSEELKTIERLSSEKPLIVGLSKVDLTNYDKVFPLIAELGKIKTIKAIVPFSSYKNRNLDTLIEEILKTLPESEEKNFEYEDDMVTDRSVRFLTAEIIREKALLGLNEELPHGVAVDIKVFDEEEKIVNIEVDIICEKDSHKSIIIGKGGSKIKEIASQARKDIEALLGKKVNLKVWVRVKKNWRQSESMIREIGYTDI